MSQTSIIYPKLNLNLKGSVVLPSSKSISNRALIIRALCDEDFDLDHLSEATDTQVLVKALEDFKINEEPQVIDVQDAGTSFRFLTAYFAIHENAEITLTGTARMHQRPIADLVEALNYLGANISYLEQIGFPPLLIKGKKLYGGHFTIDGQISSQFISALCLIAPVLENGLVMEISGNMVSKSYIEMTLRLMSFFGVQSEFESRRITISPQKFIPSDFYVESDWSSACFFYAMVMISQTANIRCNNLYQNSIQGDSFVRFLAEEFGICTFFKKGFCEIEKQNQNLIFNENTYDLSSFPDMAIPFMVACAIKYPKVKITGLKHLEFKESNRIAVLQIELKKVAIDLVYEDDLLFFNNSEYRAAQKEVIFDTYNDHRIAMALSIFAMEGFIVVLNDANCIRKSFPDYFEQLKKLGFEVIIS